MGPFPTLARDACGHAAWRRPTAECGGGHEIPDPLTNLPRPSHENLPGLLPRNAAAALLARANCKSAFEMRLEPAVPTPDNSYVTGASRRDRAAVGLRDARRELGPEEIVIGLADHLPLLPAQEGGSRGVDHEVAPIDVLYEDRVCRSIDDRLQQVVATDQLILGLATLGDVTRIHDDARDDHVVGAAPCDPFEDPPGAYPCGAPALLAATGWRPASRSDSRSARSISATSSG